MYNANTTCRWLNNLNKFVISFLEKNNSGLSRTPDAGTTVHTVCKLTTKNFRNNFQKYQMYSYYRTFLNVCKELDTRSRNTRKSSFHVIEIIIKLFKNESVYGPKIWFTRIYIF